MRYPPVWQDRDTLRVDREHLAPAVLDALPPEVEAKLAHVGMNAEAQAIYLVVGDGPLNVTERDLRHLCDRLDESGLLHRTRPEREIPDEPVAAKVSCVRIDVEFADGSEHAFMRVPGAHDWMLHHRPPTDSGMDPLRVSGYDRFHVLRVISACLDGEA